MPVSEFECQIARGQIGRYVGGGALSSDAMRGLEEHIAECPGCKALVSERRTALVEMLENGIPTTHAVVALDVKPETNPLVAALRARSDSFETGRPAPKPKAAPRYASAKPEPRIAKPSAKPTFGKPLALAAVLAVVLVAMSYLSRAVGGHGALGGKASAAFASETPAPTGLATLATSLQPAATVLPPKPAPKIAAVSPLPKPETAKPAPSLPKAKLEANVAQAVPEVPDSSETTSKRTVQAPIPRRTTVRKRIARVRIPHRAAARKRIAVRRTKRLKARKPRASVRVYGPDGRPL